MLRDIDARHHSAKVMSLRTFSPRQFVDHPYTASCIERD
jgi:hypothetical protein